MELNYNVTGAKRKELVMAIAEFTGFAAEYLKAPTMAYQVGDYHISKEGTLSWPDTDDSQILSQREHLMEQLLERGFEAEIPEADTVDGIAISMPRSMFDETALQNLQNLVVAKQELLKRAFQVEELKLEITEETVGFPWFLSEPDSMEH